MSKQISKNALLICIIPIAISPTLGCKRQDSAGASTPEKSLASAKVTLEYDGNVSESDHFHVELPLWSLPVESENASTGASSNSYVGTKHVQENGYFTVVAASSENKELYRLLNLALTTTRTLPGVVRTSAGEYECYISHDRSHFNGSVDSTITGYRYSKAKNEIFSVMYYSRRGETFTEKHVKDISESLKSAKIYAGSK